MWTARQISMARLLYNYSGRFQKFVEHMIYNNRYSVKPWISTISQAKKYSWEIYRDPQECAPYGTTLLSLSHYHILVSNQFKQFSAPLVRSWNLQLNEHQATEERVVISFSWHQDAIQALRHRKHIRSLYIND